MDEQQSIWDRLDLPVLRFVAELDSDFQWELRPGQAVDAIPSYTGDEVDQSIRRLEGYGLISGQPAESSDYVVWLQLRLRPDGLRVLGEWPPAAEADMGTALVEILRRLADIAPDEQEAKPLRRAAGSVARFAGRVVFDVAKGEVRRAGGDLTT